MTLKSDGDIKLVSFLKVVLLSATMPADVLDVTKKFMREPVRILVKKEELTLEGIRQFYINVEKEVRKCWNLILTQTDHGSGCWRLIADL